MFNNFFLFENLIIYEIMWENIVELGMSQMTVGRIRIACWIRESTNTHSEYVVYCFSTATMFAQKLFIVALCVYCLSCLFYPQI